jgi:hypothetical protein
MIETLEMEMGRNTAKIGMAGRTPAAQPPNIPSMRPQSPAAVRARNLTRIFDCRALQLAGARLARQFDWQPCQRVTLVHSHNTMTFKVLDILDPAGLALVEGGRIALCDIVGPDGHSLRAQTEDFALALELSPSKPPVLHGDAGYSLKGETPERASCYYSFTRLAAGGTVTLEGRRIPVTGSAWMDHEFSTAVLQPGITGWDWFSLQLSDNTEIMIFFLRQADGGLNPASSGTYVLPSGQTRHLQREDLRIEPLGFWTSPHTGARYPIRWRLFVDSLACELTITAQLADQEMRTQRSTNIVYWEGSVRLHGTKAGTSVEGVGYVELTGYAEPFDAPL